MTLEIQVMNKANDNQLMKKQMDHFKSWSDDNLMMKGQTKNVQSYSKIIMTQILKIQTMMNHMDNLIMKQKMKNV